MSRLKGQLTDPLLSVVMPVYNEEATIDQSLRALLLINYPEFEVVVINDGSSDRTLAAAIKRSSARASISRRAAWWSRCRIPRPARSP